MRSEKLEGLMFWVNKELQSLDHGEIHVVFKVRDGVVVLVEKMKIEKEKPE